MSKKAHEYYEHNKITIQERTQKYYQTYKNYNKFLTIFHYTNGKMCCANCGENIFELLTIDHINGGGSKHRKVIGYHNIYVWLRRNDFPNGYQVLCYNCNLVKNKVSSKRYDEIIRELQTRQLFMVQAIKEVV